MSACMVTTISVDTISMAHFDLTLFILTLTFLNHPHPTYLLILRYQMTYSQEGFHRSLLDEVKILAWKISVHLSQLSIS